MTVRELNGWSPATVTLDGNGEVLSVSVTEPRFTPAELETLLAARRLENSRNDYGIPHEVAMDPKNQHKWRVIGPRKDHAADAVRQAESAHRARNKEAEDFSSLRWSVELIDG